MIFGFLLAAIVAGAVASAALFAINAPPWTILVAYPAVGAVVLVSTATAASFCKAFRDGRARARDADHFPVQRSTTANVAASTLTSVANDKLRS